MRARESRKIRPNVSSTASIGLTKGARATLEAQDSDWQSPNGLSKRMVVQSASRLDCHTGRSFLFGCQLRKKGVAHFWRAARKSEPSALLPGLYCYRHENRSL